MSKATLFWLRRSETISEPNLYMARGCILSRYLSFTLMRRYSDWSVPMTCDARFYTMFNRILEKRRGELAATTEVSEIHTGWANVPMWFHGYQAKQATNKDASSTSKNKLPAQLTWWIVDHKNLSASAYEHYSAKNIAVQMQSICDSSTLKTRKDRVNWERKIRTQVPTLPSSNHQIVSVDDKTHTTVI